MKKEVKIVQNILTGGTGIMPHTDDHLEQAVLGAILIETDTARRYIPTLPEDYFYNGTNRLIYMACQSLYRAGKNIDILTVAEQLSSENALDAVGGPHYVTSLSGMVASSAHIEEHILILSQYFLRRRLREITMECDRLACDMSMDAYDLLIATNQKLQALSHYLPAMSELRDMPPVVENVLKQLEQRMATENNGLTGMDTGFPPLNELFLGWQKKTLNIIVGRTSEGKTAVLIRSLLAAAEQGLKVCLVSLESDAEKLAERMILMKSDVDAERFHKGTITPEEKVQVDETAQLVSRLKIKTYDRGSVSMEKVCMMVKALHANGECDLLGIDYLQLFRDPNHTMKREEEVAGNSRMLKQLSLQLEIPVIALCQFNREVSQNNKEIPKMENIRESGAIEQDADTITLIYHPATAGLTVEPMSKYPVSPDLMVLMVAKNRNGATGRGYLSHNPSFTKFEEYVPPTDYLKRLADKEEKKEKKDWRDKSEKFKEYKELKKKEEEEELPF